MIETQRRQEGPILIGISTAMDGVRKQIAQAGRSLASVLILGETGVGKEAVARSIHYGSARRSQPFIAVNCGGIPETLLESELFGHVRGSFTGAFRDKIGLARQADLGTLFLDELGEMSLRMQAALLRFAETGEIQQIGADKPGARSNARIITATNRDVQAQIAQRTFREDLYYRLNILEIRVPPLRERAGDVLPLLAHYLATASASHGLPCPEITGEAEALLVAYSWPGNVRELKNVAERLLLASPQRPIGPDDLPGDISNAAESRRHSWVGAPIRPATADLIDRLWERMAEGEDFWTVVSRPFKARELTKADLAALIDRGLHHTHGSYRAMLQVFNLPSTDYKRLLAFLYQQGCNLPVAPYRQWTELSDRRSAGEAKQK